MDERRKAGREWRVIAGALWLAAAGGAGAGVTVGGAPTESNAVRIVWQDTIPNDGYAVMARSNLVAGAWRFADTPDAWPAGGTGWTAAAETPARFFHVLRTDRGRMVRGEWQDSLSKTEINLIMFFAGIPITAVYSVTVHRLTYETFDHRGQSTMASGALIVPVGPTQATMVSYQHGTIFERTNAPSNAGAADQIVGVAMATEGYMVALPDYLGMGTNSPPLHPFLHARSEATAAVDLLRAARAYASNTLALRHNGRLLLGGYSQGGHATLALQRELETHHAAEFPVAGSAPMAGPHDLSGTMRTTLLSDAPYSDPQYVPYLLFGLNAVYGLFAYPSEVLKAPYDTTLPPLFDGAHSGGDIAAVMPSVPKQIFRDDFMAAFQSDSNHPFRVLLRANDTYGWTPRAPTRLYHCAADTVVPQANSLIAYSNFLARGATNVSFQDPAPTANHSDGAKPCFLAARTWFKTLP